MSASSPIFKQLEDFQCLQYQKFNTQVVRTQVKHLEVLTHVLKMD